jgi:hypothetical protein
MSRLDDLLSAPPPTASLERFNRLSATGESRVGGAGLNHSPDADFPGAAPLSGGGQGVSHW